MKIYGAGMAGLLAANMLRRYEPEVHELQPSLPYNHGALLRFRSDSVSKATGQPFTQVRVHKSVLWNGNLVTNPTLQMINSYSLKVTGRILPRSILNTEPVDRWIAPPDFIEKMTKGVNIILGSPLEKKSLIDAGNFGKIISTIPMPALMDLVGWEMKPIFLYDSIISVTAKIIDPMVDVYQTIYAPGGEVDWYRASITGDILILEYLYHDWPNFNEVDDSKIEYKAIDDTESALYIFGIKHPEIGSTNIKLQRYGKLKPIDDKVRRSFILGMTRKYGIYSLGRFATWRQLLLDDVVNDVNVIDRFIQDTTEYASHLGSV
jgi:hypothetical protein